MLDIGILAHVSTYVNGFPFTVLDTVGGGGHENENRSTASSGVLCPGECVAARREPGRHPRPVVRRAGRPDPAPTAVVHRLVGRRGGLRLRPGGSFRTVTADGESPHEGARGRRA